MNLGEAMKTKKIKEMSDKDLKYSLKLILRKSSVILRDYISEEDLEVISTAFFEKVKSDFIGLHIGEIELVAIDVACGEYGEIYKLNLQKIISALNKYRVSAKRYNTVINSENDNTKQLSISSEYSNDISFKNIVNEMFKTYKETGLIPELYPTSVLITYFIKNGYISNNDIELKIKKMRCRTDDNYMTMYINACKELIIEIFNNKISCLKKTNTD